MTHDLSKVSLWRHLLHPRWRLVALLLFVCAWACNREFAYLAAIIEVKAEATWTGPIPFDYFSRTILRVAYAKEKSGEEFRGLVLFKGRDLKTVAHLLPRLRPTNLEAEECMAVNLDALKGLTSLRDIIFRSCPALRNVDGLRGLTGIKSLVLGKCYSLQKMDAINELTSLQSLHIQDCASMRNVDFLTGLTSLQYLSLMDCSALQNVDAIKGLTGLRSLALTRCHSLRNLDVVRKLTGLQRLELIGCTELSPSALRDIRAALPDAVIFFPDGGRAVPPR